MPPGLNLTWHVNPPIVVLAEDKVAERVARLKENMKGWDEVEVPDVPGPGDIDRHDWKAPKRTQQERWNDRINSTQLMLGVNFSSELVVEYRVAGEPVGIMALAKNVNSRAYVGDLVTHPGSEQAGGILMEYAVRQSQSWGTAGKLELYALNDEALVAYQALGFRPKAAASKEMTLTPADCPGLWAKVGGTTWTLVKYQNAGRYFG